MNHTCLGNGMNKMYRALVFFVTIVFVILIENEVDSYPSFRSVSCPRSHDRYSSVIPCPPCYVCSKRHRCEFSTCRPQNDIFRRLAFCVLSGPREVWCTRLSNDDDRLRRVGKFWQIPLKNDSFVSVVGIEIDKAGNAFVGLIDSQQLRYMFFNADDQLVVDLDFGHVDKKYSKGEVNGIRLGDEFCLAENKIYRRDSSLDPQADQYIINKCIDVSKYVNATW